MLFMAEKEPVVITYKKSKRRRAYKFWDTAYVYEAMQEAIQIRANLEEISRLTNTDIYSLPAVSIPGSVLYQIVDSNINSFEKLLKESLIKTANISEIQQTLH
jgi:hypothetical protein